MLAHVVTLAHRCELRLVPGQRVEWDARVNLRPRAPILFTATPRRANSPRSDAGKAALYSIMFRVQPHAAIPAHSHPDDRSCFVVSGVWLFGYGDKYDAALLKALPPGSHYTEPAHVNHFAGTQNQTTVVECTSMGPAGTTFVDLGNDPRR